jgi:hypothetical protein
LSQEIKTTFGQTTCRNPNSKPDFPFHVYAYHLYAYFSRTNYFNDYNCNYSYSYYTYGDRNRNGSG